jgi:hypothetical protein
MNMKNILMGAAGLVMLSTASASATSYSITGYEWLTGGAISATTTPPTCGTSNVACSTFTYTGALNFSNTQQQNTTPSGDLNSDFFIGTDISGYLGSGTVTSGSQVANWGGVGGASSTSDANFLASSGSIAGEAYGSLYIVDLGTLAAGTLLTITHDDGIALTDSGVAFGSVTSGPTQAITETATVGTTGDIKLFYTRQNGTPSILQVAVPEPASLAVFGAALIAMAGAAGWMRRERKSA